MLSVSARPSQAIVDSHFHLWRYDVREFDWITDEMSRIRRDHLAADVEAEYWAYGVSVGVAVQARQSLEETRFLLEQKRASSRIWGVVGWLDLRSDRLAADLDELGPSLCGVRHIVQAEPDDEFLLRPDFQRGIAELRRHDLAYDILIYPKHLGVTQRFVRSHPDQRFVVDHLAKPFIKDQKLEPWASDLRALAQYPNVSAKLSGLVTEADWSRWRPEDLRPYLDVALEAFGPKRLMFGSDWPVCLVAASYDQVLGVVRDFVGTLSEDEQAAILGANAIDFYRLTPR
jgi:L-fuconolactonase